MAKESPWWQGAILFVAMVFLFTVIYIGSAYIVAIKNGI